MRALLDSIPDVDWLLGDRGYDADWFREALKDKGISTPPLAVAYISSEFGQTYVVDGHAQPLNPFLQFFIGKPTCVTAFSAGARICFLFALISRGELVVRVPRFLSLGCRKPLSHDLHRDRLTKSGSVDVISY